MAERKENYSDELVQRIVAMYEEAGRDNERVREIAELVGKPYRSVVAKLSREGVYVKAAPAPRVIKDEGPTKKELLRDLDALGFDVGGLEPATKAAIEQVLNLVRAVKAAAQAA